MTIHSACHVPLASQRRSLSLWLDEWRLHRTLPAAVADGPAEPPAFVDSRRGARGGAAVKKAQSPPPAVGQIRLLGPVATESGGARPVFVVLLERRQAAAWLAAPFSRFTHPAVPGELRIGRRAAPWAVVCLWNARVLYAEAAVSAWYCGAVAAAQVAQALGVWRHAKEGVPLDLALAQRTGPPLLHPLDPRHAYLQEERELLDESLGAGATEARHESFAYTREMYQTPLRKAAEGKEEYRADRHGS